MKRQSIMAIALAAVLAFGGIANETALVAHAATTSEATVERQEEATILPIKYDIGNRLVTLQITNPSDKYRLAYSWEDTYSANSEQILADGTVLEEAVSELTANFDFSVNTADRHTKYLYLWYVDDDGNYVDAGIYSHGSGLKLAGSAKYYELSSLLDNMDVELTNGDVIDVKDLRLEGGYIKYTIDEKYNTQNSGGGMNRAGNDPVNVIYWVGNKGSIDMRQWLDRWYPGPFKIILRSNAAISRPLYLDAVYTQPSNRVEKPISIDWDESQTGVVNFELPEENCDYFIELRSTDASRANGEWWISAAGASHGIKTLKGKTTGSEDFSQEMNQSGKVYCAAIRVISPNVDETANSEWVYSSVYDPSKTTEDVEEKLQEVLTELGVESVDKVTSDSLNDLCNGKSEEEKKSISNALKAGLAEMDSNTLRVGMQTTPATRELVEAVEKISGISVSKDISSSKIDEAKVSVTGAALNAAEGNTQVGLKVTDVSEDVYKGETKYHKLVPLGINLSGVTGELAIPVTVTLPLPAGVDADHSD